MKILLFTLTIFLTGYSGKLKYSCNTFSPFSFYVDHRAGRLLCSPAKKVLVRDIFVCLLSGR